MIFDRVLCAVDGSAESLDAARQASRVTRGSLTLVTVIPSWSKFEHPADLPDSELRRHGHDDAQRTLVTAMNAVARPCKTLTLQGSPRRALLGAVDQLRATLLVVGSHGAGRLAGSLSGSVATSMVGNASCSVLVARKREEARATFPQFVVLAVDGSEQSAFVMRASRELRDHCDPQMYAVAATDGADSSGLTRLRERETIEVVNGDAIEVIRAAARGADLIVVGSRGVRGVRRLGSVSERVAHSSDCSVLIVREARRNTEGDTNATQVSDIMNAPVVVALESATIEEATRVMVGNGVSALPIVDSGGKLVGLIDESDFVGDDRSLGRLSDDPSTIDTFDRAIERAFRGASRRPVTDVMTSPVPTAFPAEPVGQAIERMLRYEVSRLVVMRAGKPVGMLSRRDLLKAAVRAWDA